MNKRVVLLVALVATFITSCNSNKKDPRDVVISIEEAKEFIVSKYIDHELKIPSIDSVVSWKIENDDTYNHGAKHIGMYLTDPSKAEKVSTDSGENVNITLARAEAFKSELEDEETSFVDIGHEAVVSLTPSTFDKLVSSQGSDIYYLTIKKIKDKSLTITSELKDENSNDIYTRIHTYNEDGYESKFELIYWTASGDYSFNINFKY